MTVVVVRHRRRRGVLAAAGVLAVVALAAAALLVPMLTSRAEQSISPAPATQLSPTRSGLPWRSGVYAHSAADLQRFEAARGRPADVVMGYVTRDTWASMLSSDWLFDFLASLPEGVVRVISIHPIPEDSNATLSSCAAGVHDEQWRQLAGKLAAEGLGTSVIRLGWEFNGDWYKWSADDPEVFTRCWRRIVTAADAVAPGLIWEWNPNRGRSQAGHDVAAYPGDDVVDLIGVDTYDAWPPARDEDTWAEQLTESGRGLANWGTFAREHGKRLAVPEWGLSHGGDNNAGVSGGRDNPFYIVKMLDWINDNRDAIAYEAYFESLEPGRHALFVGGHNPASAAAYRDRLASAR